MTFVFVLLLLLGLQFKHLVADYFLQFDWMVAEKGDLRKLGGYAHAGMHVLGSAIVLFIAGCPIMVLLALIGAEFVIHYSLDFSKTVYSRGVTLDAQPQAFFAWHGLDQFFHHLTYICMSFFALSAMGA